MRFSKILIPRTVRKEISKQRKTRDKLKYVFLQLEGFLKYCNAGDEVAVRFLSDSKLNPKAPIDVGEAEAIIQAREQQIADVIIDEKKGRKQAAAHGLTPVGILNILVELQRQRIILNGPAMIKKLQNDLGYRISSRILASIEWP